MDKKTYNLKIWQIFSYELDFEGTEIILAGFDKKNHYGSLLVFNIYCNDNGQIISKDIKTLPLQLLCDFSDSLIKLTALKQKISMDLETVSNESDMALITKSNNPSLQTFAYQKYPHDHNLILIPT